MSKVNYITIKNKLSGFTRTVGEPEFNGMIDKADYEVIGSNPDSSWTKTEIKKYLDSNNISYKSSDSKENLLSMV